MKQSFNEFLEAFLSSWRSSSLEELSNFISKNYKAREISNGEIIDFGFEESIQGWEQGFNFVKENKAEWDLTTISIMPLREEEVLVIIAATIIINGNSLNTANLFFDTFTKVSADEWQLTRSYIESGVPNEQLNGYQLLK